MEFNERVHAYIAAKYYVHLTEHFGERGKKAFLHAIPVLCSPERPENGTTGYPGRAGADPGNV